MRKYTRLCQETIKNWNGFYIPTQDMEAILANNTVELEETLEEWGYDPSDDGMDTADRDLLHDAIAQFLGFQHWPLNMDRGEEWVDRFDEALKLKIESGIWQEQPFSFT